MLQNTQPTRYNRWLGLQSLQSKISLLIAFFVVALFVITLIVFYENRLTVNINKKGVDVNAPATIAALELIAHVRESQKNLHAYLSDPQPTLLVESDSLWTNHLEPTIQRLYSLRKLLGSNKDSQIIDAVRTYLLAFKQAQRNTMKTYREQMRAASGQTGKDSVKLAYVKLLIENRARYIAGSVYKKQVEPIAKQIQQLLNRLAQSQQKILTNNFEALESSVEVIDLSVVVISLFVALLGVLLGYAVVLNLQKSIETPTRLMNRLAQGELPAQIAEAQDEFKAITQASNQLVDTLTKAGDFAVNIGEGNLISSFQPTSAKDVLGNSLIQMREKLRIVTEDDKRRNWATEGYAILGDVLRKYNNNLDSMCERVLATIIEYIGATQGGIFIYKEADGKRMLEMKACYAYGRKKFLEKTIHIHEDYAETLIGQAYLEEEKIYMTHLPHGYTEITSGLGEITPSALLITPLKTNQRIEGIMEITALNPLESYKITFIERVSETIAVAMTSVKSNMQNIDLLQDTQHQSDTMRKQEQEMRQNIIELETAQEKMELMQDELQLKEANLSALINSTDESLVAIDMDYNILAINEEVQRRYAGTGQSDIGVGKNILDFLGVLRDEWKAHYDRAFIGEKFSFVKRSIFDDADKYRHYFVAPIRNQAGKVVGSSVFSRDISAEKNREEELENKIIALQAKITAHELIGEHFVLDWQANIANISVNFAQILGYETHELVGKPAHILGEKVGKLQKSPYWQGEEIKIIAKNQTSIAYMAQRLRRYEALDKQIHYLLFPVVKINPISSNEVM